MLVDPPGPTYIKTTHETCAFHKKYPQRKYAGCTCSGSWGQFPDRRVQCERRVDQGEGWKGPDVYPGGRRTGNDRRQG